MKSGLGYNCIRADDPWVDPVSYTHLDVYKRQQIDDMRDRLRTLETVVMNHTAVLKDLRLSLIHI